MQFNKIRYTSKKAVDKEKQKECVRLSRQRIRANRKAQGLCTECGQPNDRENRLLCTKCSTEHSIYEKEKRRKKSECRY